MTLLSNAKRLCALWNQRAGMAPEEPVLWDYHVIMLLKTSGWHVYDLDSLLPAPTPFTQYLNGTFRQNLSQEEYRPLFRIIDADEFVTAFSSDRSHMLTAEGHWLVPPPPWTPIFRNGSSNLMELIDLQKPSPGSVMTLAEFAAHFAAEQ